MTWDRRINPEYIYNPVTGLGKIRLNVELTYPGIGLDKSEQAIDALKTLIERMDSWMTAEYPDERCDA